MPKPIKEDKSVAVKEIVQSLLVVDLKKKPVVILDKTLEIEYEHLKIKQLECHSIIQTLNESNISKAESILSSSLKRNTAAVNGQTDEDMVNLDTIYARMLLNAFQFGYDLGYAAYQSAVWITIVVKVMQDMSDQIRANPKFDISDLKTIMNLHFFTLSIQQQPHLQGLPLYTESESRKMLDYMIQGHDAAFGFHIRLYKTALLMTQELEIFNVQKWLEFKGTPVEPLKIAIKEQDWPEYCRKSEKTMQNEIEAINNEAIAKHQKEIETTQKEASEKRTNIIKAKLAEAEKAMLLPLPIFPIPAPILPTLKSLFRRQIISSTPATITPIQQKPNSPIQEPIHPIRLRAINLLPPPDPALSAPLEKARKLVFTPPTIVEQPTAPTKRIEYQSIATEEVVTRHETAEIVALNVQMAVEEYRKWTGKLLEFEEAQWVERQGVLARARAEKELDRQVNLQALEAKTKKNVVIEKAKPDLKKKK